MVAESKIAALLRSLEVELQEFQREQALITEVLRERQKIVEHINRMELELNQKLAQGDEFSKRQFMQSGHIGSKAEGEQYRRRIQMKLNELAPQRSDALADVARAQSRYEHIEQEIVRVRLERRRVERLVETREERDRIVTQAQDDVAVDELSIYKHRKE